MITFIRNYNLATIKKKFILLYLLNVLDIIFTLSLLQTGYFQEVNIFMVKAVQNPLISILIKVVFPAFLLSYLYRQIKDSDISQLKVSNIAVNISLTIYAIVNATHLVWLAMLPILMINF